MRTTPNNITLHANYAIIELLYASNAIYFFFLSFKVGVIFKVITGLKFNNDSFQFHW